MSDNNEEVTTQSTPSDAATPLQQATRQSLLSATVEETKVVEIPEINLKVEVRGLMAGERDVWEKLLTGRLSEEESKRRFKGIKLGPDHSRALLVFYATVMPDGGRMFHDPADILMLSRRPAAVISKIAEAVVELSAVSEEDVDELEREYEDDPTKAPSINSQKSSKSGTSKGGAGR